MRYLDELTSVSQPANPAAAAASPETRAWPGLPASPAGRAPEPAAAPETERLPSGGLADARARQEFWLNTCREIREMRMPSPAVLDLYRQHGCRFHAPTKGQVQVVLDALDSALPRWDKDHPELFYQTLEINFPDLLRRS
jgi:hypothetical protein